jgi:ferredoxin
MADEDVAVYKVTLLDEGVEKVIQCKENVYILDAAEEAHIQLPYSCRAGSCSTCVGILQAGKIDQKDQSFLDDDLIAKGYILTCVSYPLSDVTVLTHQESSLF